jgi:hypothetical protein
LPPNAPSPRTDLTFFNPTFSRCVNSLPTVAPQSGSAKSFIHDRYVSSLLPLAFLAPETVEAIVTGTQPKDLTAKKLIRRTRLPLEWQAQGPEADPRVHIAGAAERPCSSSAKADSGIG